MSAAANALLHHFGADSAHLDFFGSPRIHPLAEAYFSQAAVHYGDYIAKLALVPVAPAQVALAGDKLDTSRDENALRAATAGYLREHDAVFDLRIQFCAGLQSMPIENATMEWKEDESPYQTVARLTFQRQEAYSDAAATTPTRPSRSARPTASPPTARSVRSCAPACTPTRLWRRSAAPPTTARLRSRAQLMKCPLDQIRQTINIAG